MEEGYLREIAKSLVESSEIEYITVLLILEQRGETSVDQLESEIKTRKGSERGNKGLEPIITEDGGHDNFLRSVIHPLIAYGLLSKKIDFGPFEDGGMPRTIVSITPEGQEVLRHIS